MKSVLRDSFITVVSEADPPTMGKGAAITELRTQKQREGIGPMKAERSCINTLTTEIDMCSRERNRLFGILEVKQEEYRRAYLPYPRCPETTKRRAELYRLNDQIEAWQFREYKLIEELEEERRLQTKLVAEHQSAMEKQEREKQEKLRTKKWNEEFDARVAQRYALLIELQERDQIIRHVRTLFVIEPTNNGYEPFVDGLDIMFDGGELKETSMMGSAHQPTRFEMNQKDEGSEARYLFDELFDDPVRPKTNSIKNTLNQMKVISPFMGFSDHTLDISYDGEVAVPTGIGTLFILLEYYVKCGSVGRALNGKGVHGIGVYDSDGTVKLRTGIGTVLKITPVSKCEKGIHSVTEVEVRNQAVMGVYAFTAKCELVEDLNLKKYDEVGILLPELIYWEVRNRCFSYVYEKRGYYNCYNLEDKVGLEEGDRVENEMSNKNYGAVSIELGKRKRGEVVVANLVDYSHGVEESCSKWIQYLTMNSEVVILLLKNGVENRNLSCGYLLHKLTGNSIPYGGEKLNWALMKLTQLEGHESDSWVEVLVENYIKLRAVLQVMHYCLKMVKETYTKGVMLLGKVELLFSELMCLIMVLRQNENCEYIKEVSGELMSIELSFDPETIEMLELEDTSREDSGVKPARELFSKLVILFQKEVMHLKALKGTNFKALIMSYKNAMGSVIELHELDHIESILVMIQLNGLKWRPHYWISMVGVARGVYISIALIGRYGNRAYWKSKLILLNLLRVLEWLEIGHCFEDEKVSCGYLLSIGLSLNLSMYVNLWRLLLREHSLNMTLWVFKQNYGYSHEYQEMMLILAYLNHASTERFGLPSWEKHKWIGVNYAPGLSEPPISVISPRLIQFFQSPHISLRKPSVGSVNQYPVLMHAALYASMDNYLQDLFVFAQDQSVEVQKLVCAAMSQLIEVCPFLEPHLRNGIDYRLQINKDSNDQVTVEACELWVAYCDAQAPPENLRKLLPRLVPMLLSKVVYTGMMNHSGEVGIYLDYDKSTQGVVFTTDMQYQPGEQIFISYGRKFNGEFLLSYGIAPREGTHPNDSVELLFSIKKSGECFNEKSEALARHGLLAKSQCFPIRVTGWLFELMEYAGLIVSSLSMSGQFEEKAAATSIKVTNKRDLRCPDIEKERVDIQFVAAEVSEVLLLVPSFLASRDVGCKTTLWLRFKLFTRPDQELTAVKNIGKLIYYKFFVILNVETEREDTKIEDQVQQLSLRTSLFYGGGYVMISKSGSLTATSFWKKRRGPKTASYGLMNLPACTMLIGQIMGYVTFTHWLRLEQIEWRGHHLLVAGGPKSSQNTEQERRSSSVPCRV